MGEGIVIVGAIEPGRECAASVIARLRSGAPVRLDHDGEFTGRPTTRVHADGEWVLKERDCAASDEPQDAETRAQDQLDRERLYRVHHPAKTWFVIRDTEGTRIGNITPRLTPLHHPAAETDPAGYFRHLRTMFQAYIRIAASFRVRLDEGLSNFAYDAQDRLYYVDDDVYAWDDFANFSQSIGVTIRKVRTLSPKFAQVLGQFVRQAVIAGFGDAAFCERIAESVHGSFFAGELQQQRRDGFIEGLLGISPHSRSRRSVQAQRPIALLADIHANLPALDAVMTALRERGISQGIVLGDLVGYGPHPGECVRLLRDSGFEIVRGNHDQAAATGSRPAGFSETAFRVIEWARQRLEAEDLEWLGRLPTRIERDGWLAQHGAPMDPTFFNAYVYRLTYEDNLRYLAEHDYRWAFHGHTHTPGVYFATETALGLDTSPRQSLGDYRQALVCPGAVGQPRRGGTDAQFAIFEPGSSRIEFLSVAYDLESTARDMAAAELPDALIERLRAGT